jgi:hypothetical protein
MSPASTSRWVVAGCGRRAALGRPGRRSAPYADQQRVAGDRLDREAVGVGDGQAMAAERNPEGGVGPGVDDAQPQPLARPASSAPATGGR